MLILTASRVLKQMQLEFSAKPVSLLLICPSIYTDAEFYSKLSKSRHMCKKINYLKIQVKLSYKKNSD